MQVVPKIFCKYVVAICKGIGGFILEKGHFTALFAKDFFSQETHLTKHLGTHAVEKGPSNILKSK